MPRPRSAIGIEIDFDRVWAVSVTDGVVDGFRDTAVTSTVAQAVSEALAGLRPHDPIRMALPSPALTCAPVLVTPDISSREKFHAEARRVLGAPGTHYVSGVIADPDASRTGATSSGLAFALPGPVVQQALDAAPGRRIEAVASPALTRLSPGAVLAVRRNVVEASLVIGTAPVAFTLLDVPGIETLVTSLGGEGARRRVAAALAGSGADPLASAEVSRWAARVADLWASAAESWRVHGWPVPREVTLTGSGARHTALVRALTARGFTPAQQRLDTAASQIPAERRPDFAAAYAAAVTCVDDQPWVTFTLDFGSSTTPGGRQTRIPVALLSGVLALAVAPAAVAVTGAGAWSAWQGRSAKNTIQAATADPAVAGRITAQLVRDAAGSRGGTLLNGAGTWASSLPDSLTVTAGTDPLSLTVTGPQQALTRALESAPSTLTVTSLTLDGDTATAELTAAPHTPESAP